MSQHTVYKCDHCKKEIGAKPHITLVLNTGHPGTGIAVPPSDSHALWTTKKLGVSFVHFHDGKCIAGYFDALIKSAGEKKGSK